MRRNISIMFLLPFMVLLIVNSTINQVQAQTQMSGKETLTMNTVGDGHYEFTATFDLPDYTTIKQTYGSDPYLIVRGLRTQRATGWLNNLDVKFDDANNALSIKYDLMGRAINRRTHWELNIGQDYTLASQSGNTLVLSYTTQNQQFGTILTTGTIILPTGSTNVVFDKNSGIVTYVVPNSLMSGNNGIYLAIVSVIGLLAGVILLIATVRTKTPPPPTVSKVPPGGVVSAPQGLSGQQKYCAHCHTVLPVEATFCSTCAQPT
ncbi:MAG TPA: hypothetical protein VJZ75_04875 [Candidatus Bathyarchaeia archaeon]|nr:hypothetical protein [Candidatus Bathyarchaeia archaeon]